MLDPFWCLWGVLGRRLEKTTKYLDLGVPLGSPRAPFFIKNRYIFQWKNASLFSTIFNGFLAPFWTPVGSNFALKNVLGPKTVILSKWASRLHESSIFESWGPQNPSKMPPKINQKIYAFFHWKNECRSEPKRLPRGTKNSPKRLPERE